jgi:CyaY protein
MDEPRYLHLADATFKRLEAAFEEVDPDVCDCERAGDVLTLTFKGGKRCVINTQRPTQQIWLAASARGWHFSYDAVAMEWRDDKGHGDELRATLGRVVKENCGLDVAFD